MFTGFVAIFIFPTVKDGILSKMSGFVKIRPFCFRFFYIFPSVCAVPFSCVRLLFVTSPPILPVSLEVSDFQPCASTRSNSPSSSAISYFIFSSSSSSFKLIGFSFFFPIFCLLSFFRSISRSDQIILKN